MAGKNSAVGGRGETLETMNDVSRSPLSLRSRQGGCGAGVTCA
ncbi:hypothetical protein O5466_24340 [Escherichia coli]|nr:hypothetical protein [Escherichia coli]